MKFYLSSYKIGNYPEKLKKLIPAGKKLGYIHNAMDYIEYNKERKQRDEQNMNQLRELGIDVELLNLQDYFGKQKDLEKKLKELGGVWIIGGNAFVLRQAMNLSGFDEIIKSMKSKDFLYSGFSAGVCVLAPNLKALQHVDEPKIMPYKQIKKPIWEGLGILDYIVLPHYKSDHPESPKIDEEVKYCEKNKIKFKPLKDGEVIIIE